MAVAGCTSGPRLFRSKNTCPENPAAQPLEHLNYMWQLARDIDGIDRSNSQIQLRMQSMVPQ
jgi:hypothetical protein